MPWRLSVLIFLFSISLSSIATAAILLPAHNSVTYDRIAINTDEARKAGDQWIVVRVKLYGVKVLGQKFLNGSVEFSYDSHFKGDRADLGLKIVDPVLQYTLYPNVAGSISKIVRAGDFNEHKRDWGTAMYVGGTFWSADKRIGQFLNGAKANSEQDYIMLAWMLANSNDIIKYAVENDSRITSKAKQGWRRLGDFTRKAYGDSTTKFNRILAAANEIPPPNTTKASAKTVTPRLSFETRDFINKLESKNKQLTYQIKTLKEAIASVRKKMKKLSATAAALNKGSSPLIHPEYIIDIEKIKGVIKTSIGTFDLQLRDGAITEVKSFKSYNHPPSHIGGSYLDSGNFVLVITADFIKKYSRVNQKRMTVTGNLFNLENITIEDEYEDYQLVAQIKKDANSKSEKNKNEIELIKFRVESTNQKNQISSLQKQLQKAQQKQLGDFTDIELKKRNSQLTLEVVSLKEQLADLNSKLLISELVVSQDASKIALNFCVSTKLKHIYAVASNTSCIRPYVQMDQPSVISFSQASGIEQVATLPWVSVKSLTNAQVKKIQYLLVREGFSTSLPDGLLGPKTIKAMQSLLSKIDGGQGNKVVSSQLYLQQDLLDLMLTSAQLAEVKELQRQTIESNNVIDIKNNQINQLTTKINDLLKTSATKGQFDEVAYELKVSKLSDKVANLEQQIIEKNLIQSKSLLSTDSVASQLTEDLVTAKATITSKNAEIKRLTNELTVAKVKSKNNQINDSSFMETLSEEWQPLIVDMPLTERLFCDLYHDFRIKKDQAEKSNNQIRVNMVHRSFQEDLDSLLPGGSLDQWIVKVLKVSQVAGGDAAIIAELPCDVLVGSGTMNTEEGSEDPLSWVATIPYSSRLYNELAKVSIGDFVNVSGTFVQIEAFESGRNETFYASNSIGKNPLVAELGLDKDLYLLDLAYFMMLR